ncbi:SigB/SigF/SigG family RNA polymerase sigma factor [Streptomyces sp. MST-110588]|uniref:SigB/SigF/SigG family RNA polymerase sigma factor n=1 Tax=Streptomyces sp. MST-110588 TaxID=2833628 RepID=UPI001F5C792D|nr:SigB/SigF/SigG family RNA polymerase sigma factor [Streptomyces sp. MST-110588]UNO39828.1 SigB/SigF/SigG family RNA polymerase sigma factor [Streptomyces sp. MST-110588]
MITAHRRTHTSPDTAEDFRRLARMAPGPDRDLLRHQVIAAWLPMAERISCRFRNKGETAADLRQVAAVALVKAVDRYDPDLSHSFEAYAVPTIIGELKRHFRDHLWTLHVPRSVQQARSRVRAALSDLEQELVGRRPTVEEIATRTGLSEEDVLLGLEASATCAPVSLDAVTGASEDLTVRDTLGAEDSALEHVINREALRPLLAGLPERERHVLHLRFFRGLSQSQIAESVGVSQMQISRILARLFRQIRQQLAACE